MGARIGTGLSYRSARARIFKLLRRPRICRFQGINSASLCSLAGRCDNPVPTRFLAPIDCLKFKDSLHRLVEVIPLNQFLNSLNVLKIRAQEKEVWKKKEHCNGEENNKNRAVLISTFLLLICLKKSSRKFEFD
jgi:hypothetical protein